MGRRHCDPLLYRACRAALFTLHAAWAGWATRLVGPLLGRSKPAPAAPAGDSRNTVPLLWRATSAGCGTTVLQVPDRTLLKHRILRMFCTLAPGSPMAKRHAHRPGRSAEPDAGLTTIGAQILP